MGGNVMLKETEDLYEDSEFYRWLQMRPSNVYVDYNPHYVDMGGTRVTITFTIDDEVTE
tara:strand:+ start:291 stop:467 length:177 start_codon:yes stop_codon:yes gene_type:complete